jgi:alpha,alpha-trehalose phosphorylase
MRVDGDALCFDPVEIPGFSDYRFTVTFRGAQIDVAVSGRSASVSVRDGRSVRIRVGGEDMASPAEAQPSQVM